LTETIYALGLQDVLVGDTDYCDYPPDAQHKPKVGGAVNPSLEAIADLHPDLVLVTKSLNRLDTVNSLADLGIPSYAIDPQSVAAIISSTQRLAEILGAPEAGEALEEIARLQPEFLVFPDTHTETTPLNIEALSDLPGWRILDAVRNHRYAKTSDAVDRPAPRIVSAIEDLARQFHPEAFADPPDTGHERRDPVDKRENDQDGVTPPARAPSTAVVCAVTRALVARAVQNPGVREEHACAR
jgi:ABC-type Fe3+-hydroxamate transport system substrate-binding protein